MVKAIKEQKKYFCHECGCELTDSNSRETANSISGRSFLCIDCECNFFARLESVESRYIALFHTAAALDFPLFPLLLDESDFDTCEEPYLCYINRLTESGDNYKSGKVRGFADGITSLQDLFGKNLSNKDFAARIAYEKSKVAKVCGSKIQREKWGTQPLYTSQNKSLGSLPMTQELYNELDRLYEIRANSYKGQTITPQMDDTLIKVAKSNVIYDHLMRQGLVKMALDVQKSIDLLLASEQMRPKDKKPTEEMRIDALVTALEDAGLMENGQLLTYDELVVALRDNFIKSSKYEYSLDVADQMMLDIINSMRQNADLLPIQDLPEEFAPVDEYGEFMPEETEQEKENKRFLGITKVNVVKSDKGEKEE